MASSSTPPSRKVDQPDVPHPYPGQTERLTLHQYWSYPTGESVPAVVLYMNLYTNRDFTYIPCEIALVSFSLRDGIDNGPGKSPAYWTLIDPISAPLGFGIDAFNRAREFGVPNPGYSQIYQDFGGITDQIEEFLLKHMHQPAGFTFLFCSMKNLAGYTAALKWLYEKAGKSFPHKLFQLESLLVTLSVGGLDSIVREGNFQRTLPEVVKSVNSIVAKCGSSMAGSRMSSSSSSSSRAPSNINSFIESTKISESSYYTIGGRTRVASKYAEKYPSAMMGAFMYEIHAEEYLTISEFLQDEDLACDYHREVMPFQKGGSKTRRSRMRGPPAAVEQEDYSPSGRLVYCALLNALRQVYLAIDALVVNYAGVKPKKRRHFPGSSSASSAVSSRKYYG